MRRQLSPKNAKTSDIDLCIIEEFYKYYDYTGNVTNISIQNTILYVKQRVTGSYDVHVRVYMYVRRQNEIRTSKVFARLALVISKIILHMETTASQMESLCKIYLLFFFVDKSTNRRLYNMKTLTLP